MLEADTNTVATISDTLVNSGEDYFARLERIISESTSEIHFQTYIFQYDVTGIKIIEALKKAALRDVKIYLLLDGFGSYAMPSSVIKNLKESGIHFRFFSPLFSANTFYIGRRLHHKVVVVDKRKVLIGGINIADKYYGNSTLIPWLDFAVELNNEKIGEKIQEICSAIYNKKSWQNRKKNNLIYDFYDGKVRISQNDWLIGKREVHDAYIRALETAKKEIIIVGSYFFPGRKLTQLLKNATQKNVKVILILSGISDIPLLRGASLFFYTELLNYNMELFEWNKSLLHGKAAIIDEDWTTIGSFNLNHLSSYGSIEMNLEIDSTEFSKLFKAHLNLIILQCQRITPKILKTKQPFYIKYTNGIFYWTLRMLLIIITYLPYKRFMKSYGNEA